MENKNPKFFYQISGTLFRTKGNESNPVEVLKVFKNENPIIAREMAFNYYQNFIDVLLESKGKEYVSHEEMEIELQDFVNSYERKYFKLGGQIIAELDVDFDKGLNIYLVMADSEIYTSFQGEPIYEDKQLIHRIDNQFVDIKMELFHALRFEYSLYEKFEYEYKNFKRDYDVSGLFEDPIFNSILDTPIDFNKVLDHRV